MRFYASYTYKIWKISRPLLGSRDQIIFKESGQKIIPYEHLRSGSQKLQTVQVKMMVIESSAPPVRASPPAEQNHQQKDKHRFTRFRHHREREIHGVDK